MHNDSVADLPDYYLGRPKMPAGAVLSEFERWPTAEDRTRKAAESIMSASLGEPAALLAAVGASTGE